MGARVIALAVALSISGCAVATIQGPQSEPWAARPTCTTSYRNAQLDVGIGGGAGVAMIVAGGMQSSIDGGADGTVLILGGLASIVVFYTSATIGYFRTKRCSRALATYDAQHAPG